jgi:hypothetical protein
LIIVGYVIMTLQDTDFRLQLISLENQKRTLNCNYSLATMGRQRKQVSYKENSDGGSGNDSSDFEAPKNETVSSDDHSLVESEIQEPKKASKLSKSNGNSSSSKAKSASNSSSGAVGASKNLASVLW